MAGCYSQSADPFQAQDKPLGVAIVRTPDDTHSLLFYFDEDDEPSVLHLALHHLLLKENDWVTWTKAIWAAPPIPAERAEALAALCDLIVRAHAKNGLPYALRYFEGTFDTGSGQIDLGPGCIGLTCSTFVVAVFKSVKIELVRQDEWKEREGDCERQKKIVAMLRGLADRPDWDIDQEHIEAVESEIGCIRFRPSDAVAAASSTEIPIGFDEATKRGEEIMAALP